MGINVSNSNPNIGGVTTQNNSVQGHTHRIKQVGTQENGLKSRPGSKPKNMDDASNKVRTDITADEKQLIEAIEKTNKAIESTTCTFEYSIHEKTKRIMVKVIDKKTKDVIREFPPEKILDMVAKIWEVAGIIVDERR
jgi:flagellar protein FlaG